MRDAAALPKRRAHPHDVVVAPLDIHVMLRAQRLHDDVGVRTAVVDVTDDVQLADGQALDEPPKRFDERDATPGAHGRVDDAGVVGFLVHAVVVLVHELFDDVGELGGQRAAHAAGGVLAGRALAHGHEARHHRGVPRALVVDVGQDEFRLFTRVVDERCQLALGGFGKRVAEGLVHFQADGARAVAQDVAERLGLAVDVGAEEFGAFREVQDGAEVDDLGGSGLGCGKRLRQQFQVTLFGCFHENLLGAPGRQSHSDAHMVPRPKRPRSQPTGTRHTPAGARRRNSRARIQPANGSPGIPFSGEVGAKCEQPASHFPRKRRWALGEPHRTVNFLPSSRQFGTA